MGVKTLVDAGTPLRLALEWAGKTEEQLAKLDDALAKEKKDAPPPPPVQVMPMTPPQNAGETQQPAPADNAEV
jgi:hypothetical protein